MVPRGITYEAPSRLPPLPFSTRLPSAPPSSHVHTCPLNFILCPHSTSHRVLFTTSPPVLSTFFSPLISSCPHPSSSLTLYCAPTLCTFLDRTNAANTLECRNIQKFSLAFSTAQVRIGFLLFLSKLFKMLNNQTIITGRSMADSNANI